ncbi:MAG: c-type cytochrome [Saprospiraceae bacterium]
MKFRVIIASLLITTFCFYITGCNGDKQIPEGGKADTASSTSVDSVATAEWRAPDTSTLVKNDSGTLILYGKNLVANTATFFGPKGIINHNANGMNCQNCHMEAGTRLYANSFSAVQANYPKFRPRSGTVEHLEKRINDCFERSMNGKKIDSLSHEMQAMVAYINWVGKDVKKGEVPKGASVIDLPYLSRAADPAQGKKDFETLCVTCHGENGDGLLKPDQVTYFYPPLWGPHSYNTAAGIYRMSRMAGYIKMNMPFARTIREKAVLTDEQAWDIAAYVNSRPRPEKKFAADWPDIKKKPVDYPFAPFADSFSEAQHKYGPYQEIADVSKKK